MTSIKELGDELRGWWPHWLISELFSHLYDSNNVPEEKKQPQTDTLPPKKNPTQPRQQKSTLGEEHRSSCSPLLPSYGKEQHQGLSPGLQLPSPIEMGVSRQPYEEITLL